MNGRLGSTTLTAGANTVAYTLSSLGSFAAATVNIVNKNNVPAKIRMALATTDTPGLAEWIEYDVEVPAKGVLERTGIVLGPSQRLVLRSDVDLVNVVITGTEVFDYGESGGGDPEPEPEPPANTLYSFYGDSGAFETVSSSRLSLISTEEAKFGTRSLKGYQVTGFAGRANAVNVPLSQALTGPLTLECWSYVGSTGAPEIMLHGPTETDWSVTASDNYISFKAVSIGSTASVTSIIQGGSAIVNNLSDTGLTPIAGGQWVHTALVLNAAGDQISVWINGDRRIQNTTLPSAFTSTMNFLTLNSFGIGTQDSYVDEIRVSNVERYDRTSSTITVPTTEFTSDANTLALIKF